MANIGAGLSDGGDQHNHYYNEMVVNNQGFLTNIHEETFCCEINGSSMGLAPLRTATTRLISRFPGARTEGRSATGSRGVTRSGEMEVTQRAGWQTRIAFRSWCSGDLGLGGCARLGFSR